MSVGFLALNNNNQVLVSEQTRNLHFIGKATYTNNQGHAYYGGLCKFLYRINSTIPVVPFFTAPTLDYYAITSIKPVENNTQFEIELIRSGTNLSTNIPEVYVFADPRASTATDPYGFLVYAADGTPAFDSRLRPLAIVNGITVTPPSNPRLAAIPYLDPKTCGSTDQNAFTSDVNSQTQLGQQATKEIFSYMSLPQAQREVTYATSEEECDGIDAYGNCAGAKRIYSWDSTYWAFYRGGIRRFGTQSIDAGWICVSYGCNWRYSQDSSFIGIGTGGESGQGGTWPYSNETLNLVASPVLIANGARYD